jgi:hypothetical protein
MRFSELFARLNGTSTPVFGVQWEAATADTEVTRRVIAFLENRWPLYMHTCRLHISRTYESFQEIRDFLTIVLGEGRIGRPLEKSCDSCGRFAETS